MSAPEGNQFWKLRSKHGRDMIFSSPTILWEACVEYFESTDKRKWKKTEVHGKDPSKFDIDLETPYTWSGLYLFLSTNAETWRLYKEREDFIEITTRVQQIIYTQKFEGAVVGAFNAQIISRDLGLKEQTESTNTNINILNVDPLKD